MPQPKRSLKTRLLRHVLLPLAATWALGTGVTLAVSHYFAGRAFDRSLLDDAYLVASRVVLRDGELALNLSQADMSTVLFDQSETEFFAVQRADGSLIAGHPGVRALAAGRDGSADISFGEQSHQGRGLRSVTLRRDLPAPFSVTMAQTTASRSRLLQQLLLYSVLPQVALLLLLAAWLRRAIRADLQPLTALQQAVEQRDAADLTPLGPALTELASSRDVQRLSGAINALLLRLYDSIQAQREFAGNVAHELRTPLAGIRALAEYGLAQPEPATWRTQLLAIVDSQGRASHLVDQLLALALADEAQGSLAIEPLQLDRLVRDVVLRQLARADACGVDLGAEGLESRSSSIRSQGKGSQGADPTFEVAANKALVEGLLVNLIDNALRYGTAPAPERSSVTVVLDHLDGCVRLSVIDNGRGLPASERERLLRRWAQGNGRNEGANDGSAPDTTDQAQAHVRPQGAGLGLAIVTRYTELMNAHFELADGPQQRGLRASVTFTG